MLTRGLQRTGLGAIAVALVAAAALPAWADWREASRAVEQAMRAQDGAALRAAIAEIGDDQSQRAVKMLLKVAEAGRALDIHDALLEALGAQTEARAVSHIRKQARSNRDWTLRYLCVEALAKLPQEDGHETLFAAFGDKADSVARVAMRTAAEMKLKEAVPALIEVMAETESKAGKEVLTEQAARSLTALTGERLADASSWRDWWKANGPSFDPSTVDHDKSADEGSATVMRRIKERGDQKWLEQVGKGDIFCVTGDYDHVESVLEALKLPHTVIPRDEFTKRIMEIPPTAVIIFNCTNLESSVRGDTAKRLQALIAQGAYVFTSDWELANVVVRAAPGYVAQGAETAEHEFGIRPAPGSESHPYMQDVFPLSPYEWGKLTWKIDEMSFCVRPAKNGVVTLVHSDELEKTYGSGIVACTFRHGKGSVLHVLSHFDKQTDESGDGFALQQMLLNFIVERQKFRARKGR